MRKSTLHSRERIAFAKQLATYLRAGIPLFEALMLLEEAAESRMLLRVIADTIHGVRNGMSLSGALALSHNSFQPLHLQLIAVGERSGALPEALTHLCDLLTKRTLLVRRITSALTYPCILFLATFSISVFLVAYVFPKILPLFRGLHVVLPLSTRALLALSVVLNEYGVFISISVILLVAITIRLFRIPRARIFIDGLLLRLPLVGELFRLCCLAYSFQVIGTLLRSGIRLDEALRTTGAHMPNMMYKESFGTLENVVVAGKKLSEGMSSASSMYPRYCTRLIGIGETTGTLADSAHAIASLCEERIEARLQLLTSLIEPVLMLVMGLIIGFVALAIITPMYGLTQGVSSL